MAAFTGKSLGDPWHCEDLGEICQFLRFGRFQSLSENLQGRLWGRICKANMWKSLCERL